MMQSRRQFVRTLFVASQAAAVGALFPQKLFAADAPADSLNFLVLGDWGREGQKEQRDVAEQMGRAGAAMGAQFVISVGDNFYEHGVKSVDDPQWQSSFEKIYTAPSLQVPWHVVLGNHDYHGECQAQVEYSKTSKRWRMPSRFFKRTEPIPAGGLVDLFFLDTTPMAQRADDLGVSLAMLKNQSNTRQIEWLEASLAASTAPWKIVVAHHPVYSGGIHGDTPYIIENVLPLLQKHGVQAYFNGHDHDLQHLQADKINLFCCGAGSKVRETKNTVHTKFSRGSTPGFVTVGLAAEQMDVRMLDAQGQLLYTATVPRRA
jgi:acid phosphatase